MFAGKSFLGMSTNANILKRSLEVTFERIVSWCKKISLVINTTKTVVMNFSYIRSIIHETALNKEPTLEIESNKFLGITLDSPLNFRVYIEKICNKVSRPILLEVESII